jgi:hypothetical protein
MKKTKNIIFKMKTKILIILFSFFLIQNSISQKTKKTDSSKEIEIEEEYIRIMKLDPALGIAIIDPKPATIERGRENGKNGSEVLNEEITYCLMDENIVVPERVLFDKILGAINLGSSELADPNMSSKQGRLALAGFYIVTKYTSNKERTTLNLRIVYTETGEIVYTNTLNYNDFEPLIEDDAEKEATKIITALEKFANKKVLIIKENPKRYSNEEY